MRKAAKAQRDRFAELLTLAPEMVSNIDSVVTTAAGLVEADKELNIQVVVEINLRWDKALGEIVPTYRTRVNSLGGKFKSAGRIRNGQLTLLGTGVQSDSDPEE